MFPNLYKGLGLKPKDLSKYDTPLIGFDRKVVCLEGQISLPVNTEGKGGGGKLRCSECFLPVHRDSWVIVDPRYGSHIFYPACEGAISY